MIGHHSRLGMRWAILTSFVSVLVLITRVIDRSTLHFAVARNMVYKSDTPEKNLTGKKCRADGTKSYKIC